MPARTLLDTSYVVEALIGSQPLHEPCRDFLVRLAAAGTQIVYSRLLEAELRETAVQLALKERHPKDWKRFRQDGRARPRANRLLQGVEQAWAEIVTAVPSTVVEIGDVADRVSDLMSRFGLASYDAVHVATALATDTPCIVTTDAGFAYVPESEVTLYVDASRLTRCRQIRAR